MRRAWGMVLVLGMLATGCASLRNVCCPPASQVGHVRHIVLFKFKDDAKPEQIQLVETRFCELRKQIPLIRDFEWGTNMSPEKLDAGFTHCFFVTFANANDRDAYLPHPAHQAFVEILKPVLDKALVIDYVAKE